MLLKNFVPVFSLYPTLYTLPHSPPYLLPCTDIYIGDIHIHIVFLSATLQEQVIASVPALH